MSTVQKLKKLDIFPYHYIYIYFILLVTSNIINPYLNLFCHFFPSQH